MLFIKWEVRPVSLHCGGDLEEEITVMVTLLTLSEYQDRERPYNLNPPHDEIGSLRRKALLNQGQQSS